MFSRIAGRIVAPGLAVGLAACSSGGGSTDAATSPPAPPSALAVQIQAATDTANNSDPNSTCGAIDLNTTGVEDGFYWEIGDENGIISDSASGLQAAGSVQPAGTSGTNYTRSSSMAVASASKWIYGAYVAETRGVLVNNQWTMPDAYLPFLHFTSGYENMTDNCNTPTTLTIQDCLSNLNGLGTSGLTNGAQTQADAGRFYYNSGHLEVLEGGADPAIAGDINGASSTVDDLTSAVQAALAAHNVSMNLSYMQPDPAGGITTTAGDYAAFLQGMIRSNDPIVMRSFLRPTATDPYAVCTNPTDPACVDGSGNPLAVYAPLPDSVTWHYSITHWIEDDPTTGDGTYSSPGKLGFYPWVDKTFTYYGVLAREDNSSDGVATDAPFYKSDLCGQAIRKAFLTGIAQS